MDKKYIYVLIVIIAAILAIWALTTIEPDETSSTPAKLYCGDGNCDFEEDCSTCAQDCGECPPIPVCDNDGVCRGDLGETYQGCEDCRGLNMGCCGDGICQEIVCHGPGCCASESCSTCPEDCGECEFECPEGQKEFYNSLWDYHYCLPLCNLSQEYKAKPPDADPQCYCPDGYRREEASSPVRWHCVEK